MSQTETGSFLADRGHGVLAFNADEPYALPISFGFDDAEDRCYLQLLFGDESKKRDHIQQSDGVCLVVYEWNAMNDWRSVVITGDLRLLSGDERVKPAEVFHDTAAIPDLSVFSDSLDDLEFGWYELEIETIEDRAATGEYF